MKYNENEINYAYFLLMRLGFANNSKIKTILETYEKRFGIIEITHSTKGIRNRKGQIYKYIETTQRKMSYQRCIAILKFEINLRFKSKNYKIREKNDQFISATEISSFLFCRASHSISKTFVIEESLNKFSKYYGTKFHEEFRLLFKKKDFGFRSSFNAQFSEKQNIFLREINSCSLIFAGHKNQNFSFQNLKKGFIGQPDYIFKDTKNEYFVVEEKFHLRNSENKISEMNKFPDEDFFDSHLAQLQSYIQYIEDYDIRYGVLVNWYYYIDDEKPIVDDFTYRILYKNRNTDLLENTFTEIQKFKKTGEIRFNANVNLNKCLNCSVNLYCGHKTDEFNLLKYPYDRNYLKLKDIEYPY
ncbi:MAG: hypothetical protein ACYCZ2_12865 [Lutibacter sp.]|nr:MAG: hypothetical protein APF83_11305 [Lutibacter sp. BRH_c52]